MVDSFNINIGVADLIWQKPAFWGLSPYLRYFLILLEFRYHNLKRQRERSFIGKNKSYNMQLFIMTYCYFKLIIENRKL